LQKDCRKSALFFSRLGNIPRRLTFLHAVSACKKATIGQLSLASLRGRLIEYTSFGWGKGGNVTSVGWQVTPRDPRVGHTMEVLSPSLSSVILIDSSMGSSVHVLMLSIQAVRGLPRLRAPGIVPCIISERNKKNKYTYVVRYFSRRTNGIVYYPCTALELTYLLTRCPSHPGALICPAKHVCIGHLSNHSVARFSNRRVIQINGANLPVHGVPLLADIERAKRALVVLRSFRISSRCRRPFRLSTSLSLTRFNKD